MSAEAGGVIPKLRFPEFLGQPLHDVQLGDVTEEATARNGDKFAAASVMGVRKEGGIVPMEERSVAGDISRYKIVRGEWFAYNPMRLNIGSIARWQGDDEVLVSPDYVVFRCSARADPTPLRPAYLDHFRRSRHWEAFTNESGDGGVRIRIYYRDLARMRLLLPEASEQQKIAECLTSIDGLIAAEVDKLEALKDHKKGLLQQLYPVPGETNPRLRFPEFQGAGNWLSKELGPNTIKVGSGITPKGGHAAYSRSGRPFLRSQNVGWGQLLLGNVAFIDEELHSSFSATEVQVGDVLLNITGASIGRSAVADARISGGNVNQHVCIIRVKSKEMVPGYLNQFLLSSRGQSQIDSFQAGGNRQGLNFEQIRSFNVPCPPTLDEQIRIADCLRSIDMGIAAQDDRIGTLTVHKSGLMQQLFPVADEVYS